MKSPRTVINVQVQKTKPTLPELTGTLNERAKQFLTFLRKNHVAMAELLPLEVEINKTLQTLYPSIPHNVINSALYFQTTCLGYLENVAKGYGRFSLDKHFIEDVSDEIRHELTGVYRLRRKQILLNIKSKPKPETTA